MRERGGDGAGTETEHPDADRPGAGHADADARAEAGSGVLGVSFGVLFFFGFLLFATQITVALYARSVVAGAALDAGRIVALAGGPDGVVDAGELTAARAAAADRVTDLLGADADFEVESIDTNTGRAVVVVRAPRPRLLLGGGTLGSPTIERRAVVRLEQWR